VLFRSSETVSCPGALHLYSPPLWRMGYYEVGEDGRVARRSASYAEELRP